MAVKAGSFGIAFAALSALLLSSNLQARPAKRPVASGELTVVLAGQSLIQSDIRLAGPLARATAPLLKADVVFTNFETTVHEEGASLADLEKTSGVYGPPAALDGLKDMGFNLLSLANNHIYDVGRVGLLASLNGVTRRGFGHSGIGLNLAQASAPGYLRTPKGRVALISMATGFLREGARATASAPGLDELALEGGDSTHAGRPTAADSARILASIREARRSARLVIAYHHNHAYDRPFVDLMRERSPDRLRPPAWIKAWAHAEVDAGADVVVMHGAPFLQGIEIYKGKAILYDLGNFIFQVPPQHIELFGQLARESAIARLHFTGGRLRSVSFHPIVLNPEPTGDSPAQAAARGLPTPATGDKARKILARLADLSREFGTELRITGDQAELALP